MRKLIIFIGLLFILYFSIGLNINNYQFNVYSSEFKAEPSHRYFDYKGVLNIHTTKSTGTGTPKEVIDAASEVGLDFIYLTDLNQFPPQTALNDYHDNLLVQVGGEYSYLDSRLLNINNSTNEHIQNSGQFQLSLANILDQNYRQGEGIFILAHPLKPRYQWSGEYPLGLDGIEVINLKSIWQDSWLNEKINFFWTLFIYPFNPEFSFVRLLNLSEKEFHLFDQLNKKHKTLAFAGTDAEARFNLFNSPIKFPSYKTLFNIVSNHVLLKSELTGNYKSDQKKISKALNNGQFYLSYDIIADPKGFVSFIQQGKRKYLMGKELKLRRKTQLIVKLPKGINVPFTVHIYKNGLEFKRFKKENITLDINEPGVYRVTVELKLHFPLPDGHKWFPWIFSNPFFIR